MRNKYPSQLVFLLSLTLLLHSCSGIKITSRYYFEHEKVLDQVESSYRTLYKDKPFSLAFTDKLFRTLSMEIITDSLTYIYEFNLNEKRMNDTAAKYHIDTAGLNRLVGYMRSIHCTWVNTFDYYVDDSKRMLIFISVKPVMTQDILSYKKYYILTYYTQPQHFDPQGRLLDKRKLRRIRKINGEIFYRINDKVCYTISGQFR